MKVIRNNIWWLCVSSGNVTWNMLAIANQIMMWRMTKTGKSLKNLYNKPYWKMYLFWFSSEFYRPSFFLASLVAFIVAVCLFLIYTLHTLRPFDCNSVSVLSNGPYQPSWSLLFVSRWRKIESNRNQYVRIQFNRIYFPFNRISVHSSFFFTVVFLINTLSACIRVNESECSWLMLTFCHLFFLSLHVYGTASFTYKLK